MNSSLRRCCSDVSAGKIFGHLADDCMELVGTLSIRLLRRLEHPGVGAQEVECAEDPLLDRELWRPAERPHAAAVEEDERAVADPATFAARVTEPRGEAERAGDPADRVVHHAILVRTE